MGQRRQELALVAIDFREFPMTLGHLGKLTLRRQACARLPGRARPVRVEHLNGRGRKLAET